MATYVHESLCKMSNIIIGPIVGGYLAEYEGWRWTLWIIIILGGALLVPLYFMEESYKPVILKRRALSRGEELPPKPDPKTALKLIFTITLARPIMMLLKEPIVQAVALYSAFAFAVLFGFFEAYPVAFQKEYGFALGETGLCFLGIAAGLIIGCIIYLIQDRLVYVPALKKYNGSPPAEIRLVSAMIGSFLMPIGLFWFAWTARKDVHWIFPVLAGVPFGSGLVLIFVSPFPRILAHLVGEWLMEVQLTAIMYILEVYPPLVAASAIAALGLLRYLMAMAFPLFTVRSMWCSSTAWFSC